VREGKVPSIWKKANVVPVAKVRPPLSMESPTISKVPESMADRWILDVVGSQLHDHHFGSLKGLSTTHALADMLHHWNKALDDSQSVRVLFIDCAKASLTFCNGWSERLLLVICFVIAIGQSTSHHAAQVTESGECVTVRLTA